MSLESSDERLPDRSTLGFFSVALADEGVEMAVVLREDDGVTFAAAAGAGGAVGETSKLLDKLTELEGTMAVLLGTFVELDESPTWLPEGPAALPLRY